MYTSYVRGQAPVMVQSGTAAKAVDDLVPGTQLSAVEADPLRNERPESGSIPDRSTAPPSNATGDPVPLPRSSGEGAGQFFSTQGDPHEDHW